MEQFSELPITPDQIPEFASELNIDVDINIDTFNWTFDREPAPAPVFIEEEVEGFIYFIRNINNNNQLAFEPFTIDSVPTLIIYDDDFNYEPDILKPIMDIIDNNKQLDNYECPICYEDINETSELYCELDCCQHKVCKECILKQVQTNKYCCAICRRPITRIYTKN